MALGPLRAFHDPQDVFFDKEFPNANFALAIFAETHNIIHTPTPVGHTHLSVIKVIRRDLEIISSVVQIPGRLLNVKFRTKAEDKLYNFSAYYRPILKTVSKKECQESIQNFALLHSRKEIDLILGDFNFIDHELDKDCGLDIHDKNIYSFCEDF